MEIWKDIIGYEGLYQVSNFGRVKSMHKAKHIIVKISKNNNGYMCFNLNKNNRHKHARLHRIIAQAFIPNPENKSQVNHIDGDKLNNSIDNLEWVNNRENLTHFKSKINKSSKYTGVSYNKVNNNYFSCIQINGKTKYLGSYKTDILAHKAYIGALNKYEVENKYANLKTA